MLPEQEYERVLLELDRDVRTIEVILARVRVNHKRLLDDFYGKK